MNHKALDCRLDENIVDRCVEQLCKFYKLVSVDFYIFLFDSAVLLL